MYNWSKDPNSLAIRWSIIGTLLLIPFVAVNCSSSDAGSCDSYSDCAGNEFCNADSRKCETGGIRCSDTTDCAGNSLCLSVGMCVTSDETCTSGADCRSGKCTLMYGSSRECLQGGNEPDGKACGEPCSTTTECRGGGRCHDTTSGRVCVSWMCEQNCFPVNKTCSYATNCLTATCL